MMKRKKLQKWNGLVRREGDALDEGIDLGVELGSHFVGVGRRRWTRCSCGCRERFRGDRYWLQKEYHGEHTHTMRHVASIPLRIPDSAQNQIYQYDGHAQTAHDLSKKCINCIRDATVRMTSKRCMGTQAPSSTRANLRDRALLAAPEARQGFLADEAGSLTAGLLVVTTPQAHESTL